MKSILIVDADLGFVVWLACALYEARYQAVPAANGWDAVSRLAQFTAPIDLLIVDPAVPGLDDLVHSLRRRQQHIHLIAATGDAERPSPQPLHLDASLHKPSNPDAESKQERLELIQIILAGHPVTH